MKEPNLLLLLVFLYLLFFPLQSIHNILYALQVALGTGYVD